MTDPLTPLARSAFMARIKSRDTKPEMVVRRLLHRLGYRYRVQYKPVPGRPDIAFPRRRKAIQVHGCFWHGHRDCRRSHVPSTRSGFWAAKFDRNRERDERQIEAARLLGWRMLVIWECEVGDVGVLASRLQDFLGPSRVGSLPAGVQAVDHTS